MNTYQITCKIGSTNSSANLGLEIWLDEQLMYNIDHVSDEIPVNFEVNDDEAEHELKFVMKNKNSSHTTVDESGNIVSDARLIVSNLAFDEIELKQIFIDKATYTHDFNGTQDKTTEKFYGEMGCNGTVSLRYANPIYLWLLEHM
jgi:hypothetical protein